MSPVSVAVDAAFKALEDGDADAYLAVCAEDLVVWHNYDQVQLDREQLRAALIAMFAMFPQRRYPILRRHAIAAGEVVESLMAATDSRGNMLRCPLCTLFTWSPRGIVRVEEYLDPAALRAKPAR